MTHQHAEAFKIMQYRCAHGHMEAVWNSRDGVTPFIVDCRACGADAEHVNWSADRYDPTYDPPRGHRYFRDGRPEEARAIMRARIDSMRSEYPITDEEAARLVREAGDPGREYAEFCHGWPMLVERGTDADTLPGVAAHCGYPQHPKSS